MKRYIEIDRVQTEEQIANGEPQEQIRVAVPDEMTGEEIIDRIAVLRASVGWTAENSSARLHLCRHDETPPMPCEMILEDEIA